MTWVMPKSASSTTLARWNVGEPSSRHSITPSKRCGTAAACAASMCRSARSLCRTGPSSQSTPSQRRSASTLSSPPGRLRAGSVSSIRSSSQSPKRLFATALSALPTCNDPVGLGANRTRVMARTYRETVQRLLDAIRAAARYLEAHPRTRRGVQLAIVAIIVAFCVWGVRHEWSKAGSRLEHARPGYVALGLLALSAYYLIFILGWIRMLAAWGIAVPYRVALQAEMVSMLAKYIPGGVWTPAARAVALRRAAGVTDTPTVLASILVEAALSAISGVMVFVVSLAWVR